MRLRKVQVVMSLHDAVCTQATSELGADKGWHGSHIHSIKSAITRTQVAPCADECAQCACMRAPRPVVCSLQAARSHPACSWQASFRHAIARVFHATSVFVHETMHLLHKAWRSIQPAKPTRTKSHVRNTAETPEQRKQPTVAPCALHANKPATRSHQRTARPATPRSSRLAPACGVTLSMRCARAVRPCGTRRMHAKFGTVNLRTTSPHGHARWPHEPGSCPAATTPTPPPMPATCPIHAPHATSMRPAHTHAP
jgi:hypothetical protein